MGAVDHTLSHCPLRDVAVIPNVCISDTTLEFIHIIQANITLEWMPEDFINGKLAIGSDNGLVRPGNNPSTEPVLR